MKCPSSRALLAGVAEGTSGEGPGEPARCLFPSAWAAGLHSVASGSETDSGVEIERTNVNCGAGGGTSPSPLDHGSLIPFGVLAACFAQGCLWASSPPSALIQAPTPHSNCSPGCWRFPAALWPPVLWSPIVLTAVRGLGSAVALPLPSPSLGLGFGTPSTKTLFPPPGVLARC